MASPHVYAQVVKTAGYAAIGVVSSAHHFRWRIASLILMSSTMKVFACCRCTTTQVRKRSRNPTPPRLEKHWLSKSMERTPPRRESRTKAYKLDQSGLAATFRYLTNVWRM